MAPDELPEGSPDRALGTSAKTKAKKIVYLEFPGAMSCVEVEDDADNDPVPFWYILGPVALMALLVIVYLLQLEQ